MVISLYMLAILILTILIVAIEIYVSLIAAAYYTTFNFSILAFDLILSTIVIILFSIPFWKTKILNKIITFITCIAIFIFSFAIPAVNTAFEYETCIDTKVCKQGITLTIDGEYIEVNKNSCFEHNWVWEENSKHCIIKEK